MYVLWTLLLGKCHATGGNAFNLRLYECVYMVISVVMKGLCMLYVALWTLFFGKMLWVEMLFI